MTLTRALCLIGGIAAVVLGCEMLLSGPEVPFEQSHPECKLTADVLGLVRVYECHGATIIR